MKIENNFKANVLFEINVSDGNNSYLVIYGEHINGYYCCIPNWKIGCEMAAPGDIYYNKNLLFRAGLEMETAEAIANVIAEYSARER